MSKNINDVFESITPNATQKTQMFNNICEENHNERKMYMKNNFVKRPIFRPIIALATTAAVACLFVFGALPHLGGGNGNGDLPGVLSNNSFMLRAYAMEQQENIGAVGLTAESVGVRFEGENIASAVVSADIGKLGIVRKNSYSSWLDEVGTTVELVQSDLPATLPWMLEGLRQHILNDTVPEAIVITAVVTFENGEVQEQSITFNPWEMWDRPVLWLEDLPEPSIEDISPELIHDDGTVG